MHNMEQCGQWRYSLVNSVLLPLNGKFMLHLLINLRAIILLRKLDPITFIHRLYGGLLFLAEPLENFLTMALATVYC